jgi:hypothetical protein
MYQGMDDDRPCVCSCENDCTVGCNVSATVYDGPDCTGSASTLPHGCATVPFLAASFRATAEWWGNCEVWEHPPEPVPTGPITVCCEP